MSGYVPVFDTALDGTLFGRWPHTGVWLCLLSQSDKRGHIDVVPQLLAAKLGIPVAQLLECIADFMEPDPGSRTQEQEGRRLVPIDPSRSWGWRIVNHAHYREKARLTAKSAREVDNGENTARLRDRRRPPPTAGDRPSDANANANANADSDAAPKASLSPVCAHIQGGRARKAKTVSRPALTDGQRELFEQAKKDYPNRDGALDWAKAESVWAELTAQGVTAEELHAGTVRYRRYVDSGGVSEPKYVLMPGKFFGDADRHWELEWKPAAQNYRVSKASEASHARNTLRHIREHLAR